MVKSRKTRAKHPSAPAHGGERVAAALEAYGVRWIFTLCGGHISPILVAAKKRGIRIVDTRDEVTAVFAADAAARLTGTPGVAAVTAGPGITNTITALKNAQLAQSPVLLLGGAAPTALQGRGEKLGHTIEDLDSYLKAVNQHLPTLREDLTLFSEVADTYAMAAPDIVSVLRNATVTANTINRQSQQLGVLFSDMTKTANVSDHLLRTNEQAMIKEGKLIRPLASLLDTYSPQYVCMLQALSINTDVLGQVFRGNTVRQALDLDAKQHQSYTQNDRPVNGEAGANKPWCVGLPNPPVPFKGAPLRNGYKPAATNGGGNN